MDPYENNGAPPAGGFGAPTTEAPPRGPFGPAWGPIAPPAPGVPLAHDMARVSLYLGLASIPGTFFCSYVGVLIAFIAVGFGITELARRRGRPPMPGRQYAIGGLCTGGFVILATAGGIAFWFLAGIR